MAEFKTLEDIFVMLSPTDLAGKKKLNLGGSATDSNSQFKLLADALENDGRGVLTTEDLKARLEDVAKKGSDIVTKDLNLFFDLYSSKGFLSYADANIKKYQSKDGPKDISDMKEILGKEVASSLPPKFDFMFLLSRSPFFHPSKRHTKRVELFLNSMPSTVIAQMSPYLDVEFAVTKDPSTHLQTTSQLKFLLGAAEKEKLEGANKAMMQGQSVNVDGTGAAGKASIVENDFFGMEMFTSPQTLVNPQPNLAPSDGSGLMGRYADILDPFRPFASLENAVITVTPAVGIYTYKKANLTIKLHDRSRLAEISDLIRPRSYSNVTVWLTYGWRAPSTVGGANPYFDFINNNMLMREAYGIINSSFSFDQVGQVVINLQLFTKGVAEMRSMKITDTFGDAAKTLEEIKQLAEEIAKYRKRLKLDAPEGINKEIRAYQILDSAQVGEFPDFKTSEVHDAVKQLKESFGKSNPDPDAAQKLFKALDKLYSSSQNQSKFDLKSRLESTATKNIQKKFNEMLTGPDPFLPHTSKGDKNAPEIVKELEKYNADPKTKVTEFKKHAVSFGKLFSVFATDAIIHAGVADELQVMFYNLNGQCGPISGHSIAEFPLDMTTFLDQYRDHTLRRGGERITLEEFLGLVVNAQILDNRAIGYGLRSFYEPYDPKNKDAQVKKDQEKNFESALSSQSKLYGPFKKPVIEMYIESTHARTVLEGESDILRQMAYSAKDATMVFNKEAKAGQFRRIMRIHIYDKQVPASIAASQLLKSSDGGGFVEVPSTEYARQVMKGDLKDVEPILAAQKIEATANDKTNQVKITKFTTARQVKDVVSRLMPTITYGTNGSTIISANLTSKADPLLSTVNMLRSNTVKNTMAPNGAGEGGVPLRVIPATLTMTTLGCPLATMAQQYFIDFNTGTSVDNLYICTGLTHTLAPGKYETQWTFGYQDAYGVFESAPNIVDFLKTISADIPKKA